MSTNAASEFKDQNTKTDDIVQGGDTVDNSYASGDNEPVAVLKDEEPVEQPNNKFNPDSNEALERDEREAIDKSNILKGDRTRHAKPVDTYKEPSDEQGLPKTVLDGTDGMSSTRWVVLGQEGVGNRNSLKGLMYLTSQCKCCIS